MELTAITFLIVCPLVFLAGFVDAIAGGGGLISLPAYLLAGVPIHFAIATNKLSSAAGTLISTIRYCKNRHMDLPLAIPSVIVALGGSYIGANLTMLASERVLQIVLIVMLPIVAFYVLRTKDFKPKIKKDISRRAAMVIATISSFLIGLYDGFYGPGTGTFLLLVFTGLIGMDVLTASGNVKLVNLASNLAALVTFIAHGQIFFLLGVVASLFSIAGHYLGAGMVMKNGTKIVRPIILVVLALLFIKIVWG